MLSFILSSRRESGKCDASGGGFGCAISWPGMLSMAG